jgi:hypothetical protein
MQSRPDSVASGMAEMTPSFVSVARADYGASDGTMSEAGSEGEGSVAGRILTRRKRGHKDRLWATGDSDSDISVSESAQKGSPTLMSTPKVPSDGKGRGEYRQSVGLSQAVKELVDGPKDSDSSALTATEADTELSQPASRASSRGRKKSPLIPLEVTVEDLQKKAKEC